MDKRLFPITKEMFDREVRPLMDLWRDGRGRKAQIPDYYVFCAILYVLRTGVAWRDLPKTYGYWHTVYLRFLRGSRQGMWWDILLRLQMTKKIKINIIMADSTTVDVHRHGSGGLKHVAEIAQG